MVGHDAIGQDGQGIAFVGIRDTAHEMIFVLVVIVDIRAVVAAHDDMVIGSWPPVSFASSNDCRPLSLSNRRRAIGLVM